MRGIPLKIKTTIQPPSPEATPPPRPNGGDPIRGHDEASVDSELSVLGAFRDDPATRQEFMALIAANR